jgi:hypothetical protein
VKYVLGAGKAEELLETKNRRRSDVSSFVYVQQARNSKAAIYCSANGSS